ncbi:MAG: hypothetical protein ACOCQW_01085 [Halanaerobiaceae bacterium]
MKKYKYLPALFLTSLSLFSYQLLASRLFSVLLSTQYSYLVISFSILGLGIGGISTYYLSKWDKYNINLTLFAFIILYIGSITFVFLTPYLGSPIWYIILGMLPYIFGGSITSYIFKVQSNAYKVYFADLIGGITGLIVAMLLMNQIGTIQTIVISYLVLLFIPLLINYNRKKLSITIVLLLVLTLNFGNVVSLYGDNFNSFLTSPNVRFAEDGEYKYSSWDSFAKTDVYWRSAMPDEMMVGINGRSFSRLIKYDGDLSGVEYLKDNIGYFPIDITRPDKIAIIGSGGGEEILFSFLAGIEDITTVEINSGTINAVEDLQEFSGNIYNDPRVETIIGDGRSFIKNTDEKYDQIYLGLVITNIGDNVANNLSENFIYTREAIDDYFSKLKPDGNISFLMHSSHDLFKIITTAISYFEEQGIPQKQITDHFVIVNYKDSPRFPLLMIKENPYSEGEVNTIKNELEDTNLKALHLPNMIEIKLLNQYKNGDISLGDMVNNSSVNITPVSDDRPFFYIVEKGIPDNLSILVIGTFVLLLLSFLIVFFRNIKKKNINFNYIKYFLTFTFLGMGFMFIEITLIQKLSVFLEHPTTSFVTIIVLLLLGAGIGNLVQSKKEIFQDYKSVLYLVILSIIILVLINQIIYWESLEFLSQKIIIISILLLPLGFLMGIPFPMVLNRLKEKDYSGLIPFFWGINGIASVLGSGLTMIIALSYGFNISFFVGVILYSVVGLLIKSSS